MPGSGSSFYQIGTNVDVSVSPTITKADGTAGVDVVLGSASQTINNIINNGVIARVLRNDGVTLEVVFSITATR